VAKNETGEQAAPAEIGPDVTTTPAATPQPAPIDAQPTYASEPQAAQAAPDALAKALADAITRVARPESAPSVGPLMGLNRSTRPLGKYLIDGVWKDGNGKEIPDRELTEADRAEAEHHIQLISQARASRYEPAESGDR
jgi:hypothetical protein